MNLKLLLPLSLSLAVGTLFFISCNETPQVPQPQVYTDLLQPASFQVVFPKGSATPTMAMSIDHLNGLIYNTQYLPYGTKLDSAYLRIRLSSECTTTITNETTNKSRQWLVTDTAKWDVSGGKLQLTVQRNGEKVKTLNYKIRLQIYGYNPNKLTWLKQEIKVPPSTEARFVTTKGKTYWLARNQQQVDLYEVTNPATLQLTLKSSNLPPLRLQSIVLDHNEGVWGLSDQDEVYRSTADLSSWEKVNTGDIRISTLAYDATQTANAPVEWKAIGYAPSAPQHYFACTISNGETHKGTELSEEFPVRNAYVFTTAVAGIIKANIVGGQNAKGEAVRNLFFTSDGDHWAKMPYRGEIQTATEGALYLTKGNTLYMIGGKYAGKESSAMYISNDKGISWTTLTKEQEPGKDFAPRMGASGLILNDTNQEEVIYIVGGTVGGKASTEVWKGFQDKKGGIINDIRQ